MNRVRWTFALALVWLGCESNVADTPSSSAPAQAAEQAPSSVVRFVIAQSPQNAPWLDAPARTLAAPDATAVISAPLPARVTRIRVRPGQTVEANAPVVDVVMPEIVRAAGAWVSAGLRLDAHQNRLNKLQPLVAQGLARAVEAAEIEAQVAMIKAELESARATLRSAGVSDAEAAGLIHSGGALALRAPIAGTVTAVHASLGQYREPAAGPLVELGRSAAVQVEARLLAVIPDSVQLAWVDRTPQVPLTLEAVSPVASTTDGTRVVWLRPSHPDVALAAGTLGRVRLLPPPTWVSLPARAVGRDARGSFVSRQTDSGTTRQPVTLEMSYGDNVLISGLSAGTRVAQSAVQESGSP